MDRKNLWSIGSRGGLSILQGPVANRPLAGHAGRVYVVTPVVAIATSVGGTAYTAPQMDSGSEWVLPTTRVYINPTPLTLTATAAANTQRSMLKITLKPNILGAQGVFRITKVGTLTNLATAGGSVTATYRLKLSTATLVSIAQLLATTVNGVRAYFDGYLYAANATNAQTGSAITWAATLSADTTNRTAAIDSTASQVLDLTVSFNRQITNPAKANCITQHVAVDWVRT